MTSPHWPLAGLRLRTPRLELRWPSLEDLDELVALAAAGVHDPQVQPFSAAWTDVAAAELPWFGLDPAPVAAAEAPAAR
jgi:hypothetical protein